MRWLLLLGIIALATVARAEEEALQEEEGVVDLLETADEDTQLDIARMMRGLFVFDDADDEEHDEELGVERESRAMEEESALEMKAVVEPEDQARYNKFMDTFFRRLNADARSTIDPLEVGIVSKKKKTTGNKKSDKKSPAKKGNTDEERKGKRKGSKGNKKKGSGKKPKNKKNKKNKNKNKKKGRHPKSLNLEEIDEEDDDGEEAAIDVEGLHVIVAREAEHVEEIDEDDDDKEALERQERSIGSVDDDDEEIMDSSISISRSGKPKGNKKSKGKKKKQAGKRKGGKGKKGNKNNKKKNKRSTNKNKNKGNKSKGPKTSRASVSGIATLTRIGDVSVVNRKDGKELRTDFKMGPVNLKVNRKFGSGKNAVVKTAMAESPELTGKMYLAVAANGRAKITKFNIVRPSVVTTSGSLNKDGARLDNNNFMEKSINRIVPAAAKKLKLTARDVLRATESKN